MLHHLLFAWLLWIDTVKSVAIPTGTENINSTKSQSISLQYPPSYIPSTGSSSIITSITVIGSITYTAIITQSPSILLTSRTTSTTNAVPRVPSFSWSSSIATLTSRRPTKADITTVTNTVPPVSSLSNPSKISFLTIPRPSKTDISTITNTVPRISSFSGPSKTSPLTSRGTTKTGIATNKPTSTLSSFPGLLSSEQLSQLLGGIAIGVGGLLVGLASPFIPSFPKEPLSSGTATQLPWSYPTFPATFTPSNVPSAPEVWPWSTDIEETKTPWSPKLKNPMRGPTFQIILSGALDLKPGATSVSPDVDIYDLDLFMTDQRVINGLKRLNKTVICYFSAGTHEPDRPDSNEFLPVDMGSRLPLWPDEKWLWHPSKTVRRIMANRIQLAAQKGCDAVDPDNIDGYQSPYGGGFLSGLTPQQTVRFIKFLSYVASRYRLGISLKNGVDILPLVRSQVNFAVNEECVLMNECEKYYNFLNIDRKQVFHIEYPVTSPRNLTPAEIYKWCAQANPVSRNPNFTTALKVKSLNGWVEFCDGSLFSTPVINEVSNRFNQPRYLGQNFTNDLMQLLGLSSQPRLTNSQVDNLEKEIARRDGYPFPRGRGSENIIPDSILERF